MSYEERKKKFLGLYSELGDRKKRLEALWQSIELNYQLSRIARALERR